LGTAAAPRSTELAGVRAGALTWSAPTRPRLADACAPQRRRAEVARRVLHTEVIGAPFLVVEADAEVATGLQVHGQLERRPERGNVIVVDGMGFLDAPDLVAVVVAVHHHGLPGVLVDIEGAALVDV